MENTPKNAKGRQPTKTQLREILKPRYKLGGTWFLHLAGQGSQIAPLPSRQLFHCNKNFRY